ncbi:glutamate synthase, partial [Caerostris extrusa]
KNWASPFLPKANTRQASFLWTSTPPVKLKRNSRNLPKSFTWRFSVGAMFLSIVLSWDMLPRLMNPLMRQVFIAAPTMDSDTFRREVFVLRKYATHKIPTSDLRFYICNLSPTTVVYKGQLTSTQLWNYFADLKNPAFETYLALVHARFSTNTFPSWERAHPMRMLAHNGEINTLRGNINLMRAREGVMESGLFKDELHKLYPVVEPNLSDSGCADNVLEFLVMAGQRSLPEAIMTMVPEAWQNDPLMHPDKKAFYRWSGCVMEPWDGPALLTFTDGNLIGAILDRNGLRPSRYYLTKDNHIVMASEVGVLDLDAQNIAQKVNCYFIFKNFFLKIFI